MIPQPYIEVIKEYVRERERVEGSAFPCDMRQFSAAVFVIRRFLGDDWLQGKVSGNIDKYWRNSEGQFGDYRWQSRMVDLAEILLNLTNVDGLPERLKTLRTESLETATAELDGAGMLIKSGIYFRFVNPCGILGQDYDVAAMIDGESFACEVKSKLEQTEPKMGSVKDTLDRARRQLPTDQPGIVFLKLPEAWGNTKEGRIAVEDGISVCLRQTLRISAIIAHWEQWQPLAQGAVRKKMFKSYSNPKARNPLKSLERVVNSWDKNLGNNWIGLEQIVCEKADVLRQFSTGLALAFEAFAQGKGSLPKVTGTLYGGKPEVLASLVNERFITCVNFLSNDFIIHKLRPGGVAHITLTDGPVRTFSVIKGREPGLFQIQIPHNPLNEGWPKAVAALSKQLASVNSRMETSPTECDPIQSFRTDPVLCLIHSMFDQLRIEGDLPIRQATLRDLTVSFLLPERDEPEFWVEFTRASFEL